MSLEGGSSSAADFAAFCAAPPKNSGLGDVAGWVAHEARCRAAAEEAEKTYADAVAALRTAEEAARRGGSGRGSGSGSSDDVRCAQEECEAARVAFIQREAAAGGALLAIKLVFNHVQRQGYSKEV